MKPFTEIQPKDNTIEQHAVMAALLAKYAISEFGDDGRDAFVSGITRMGIERGTRMAARAILRGDRLDYVNYQAYGEWKPQPGQMDFAVAETQPETVTVARKCAWNEAWKKHGLEEYGKYYCVTVDDAIARGFWPDLRCDTHSNLSWGASQCEFHWGVPMSEEDLKRLSDKKAELGDTCVRDFNYHVGHVLCSIGDELRQRLGKEAGDRIVDSAVKEFTEIFGEEYVAAFEDAYPGDPNRL